MMPDTQVYIGLGILAYLPHPSPNRSVAGWYTQHIMATPPTEPDPFYFLMERTCEMMLRELQGHAEDYYDVSRVAWKIADYWITDNEGRFD